MAKNGQKRPKKAKKGQKLPMALLVHGELGDGRDVDVATVVSELEVDELKKKRLRD